MEEVWLDIAEFENKYKISNKGHVQSLNYNNTGKPKILKPKINKQGHLEVTLNKHDKHYYRLVSRLVFETFTGMKLGKNDILMYHDKDKTNCTLDNMYLITRGKRQEITYDLDKRKTDKLGKKYLLKYEFYGKKLNNKEISKITGMDRGLIRERIKRLNWNIYEASEVPVAKMGGRKNK